jgi:hypothetical protein
MKRYRWGETDMEDKFSALIIKSPWVDLILSGEKTWEIRGNSTKKRGWIALIKSGSKKVIGICQIVDVIGPLTMDELLGSFGKHRMPTSEIRESGLPYPRTYAWVIRNPVELADPILYKHPMGAITWVTLPSIPNLSDIVQSARLRYFQSPSDELRIEFLENLSNDLKFIGHKVSFDSSDQSVNFSFSPLDFSLLEYKKIRDVYKSLRNRNLKNEIDFINKMEADGISDLFIDGQALNTESIRPEIRICTTKRDKQIYRYCRNLQSIPTSSGVGRHIGALVYDLGQSKETIMGVIGLTSTLYSVRDRDAYFSWDRIDSRLEEKRVRELGLRRLMQLSVCLAIPPYNHLHVGKLIALIAFADPIQEEFQRKYGGPLLGLQTTSALRKHAPIFNRIHVNRLEPETRYQNYANELYRRIGEVSGKTTLMISEDTLEKARILIDHYSKKRTSDKHGIRSTVSRSRVVSLALRICGISDEVLQMNEKGLYFAYLHEQNKIILERGLEGVISPVLELDVDAATEYWSRNWLTKAKFEQAREFSKDEIVLSKQIDYPMQVTED